MSDYRIKVTVSNAHIRRAMEDAGFYSLKALCESKHLSLAVTYLLINMKLSPLKKSGEWRKAVVDLANALKVLPEDLFSERQLSTTVSKNTAHQDVTERELEGLVAQQVWNGRLEEMQENQAVRLIAQDQTAELLDSCLKDLPPKTEFVIRARHGLIDGNEMTLKELADSLGVSRERVRQIYMKGLRQIRMRANREEKVKTLSNVFFAGDFD